VIDTARKLAALPRAALIELVMRLGAERNAAMDERDRAKVSRDRALAYATFEWRTWDADRVRRYAQTILDGLPTDPNAGMHLDTLAAEVEAHDSVQRRRPRELRPGPRCHRGTKPCMKPLNDDGLCPRHDAKKVRAARAVA
jgi:hypothetical protein